MSKQHVSLWSAAAISLMMGMSAVAQTGTADASLTMVDQRNGIKIEAEAGVVSSTAKILEDSTASEGKCVSPDGKATDKQSPFLEFRYMGKYRMSHELHLRVKVEGSEPVRIYYKIDKNPRFPMNLKPSSGWYTFQIGSTYAYKTIPHNLMLYCNDSRLKVDTLHFEDSSTDTLPEGNSLTTLPPIRKKPRIQVPDINFVPANVGDAIVCLWKNDAIGCATYTADDNLVGDMPWWFEVAKKYGARITWFAIADCIGDARPARSTWADFRRALAEGHDVQSHSYSHLSDRELTIEEEYAKAKEILEKNLPGHKILAVAFPGGGSSAKNLTEVSARYHIAARGVSGHVNGARGINYMCTNSFGSQNLDPKSWQGLTNMVKLNPRFRNSYRAWYSHHFHTVKGEGRKSVEKGMAFYHKHNVWMPSFVDAAKYGQERDTATLKTVVNKPAEIVLSLTDKMEDSLFDLPLTLRVHVADDWKSATATQGGKTQELKVIDINGKKTLMFDAIPDRGTISVKKTN